jgi:hypothetical protein
MGRTIPSSCWHRQPNNRSCYRTSFQGPKCQHRCLCNAPHSMSLKRTLLYTCNNTADPNKNKRSPIGASSGCACCAHPLPVTQARQPPCRAFFLPPGGNTHTEALVYLSTLPSQPWSLPYLSLAKKNWGLTPIYDPDLLSDPDLLVQDTELQSRSNGGDGPAPFGMAWHFP